ncbi:MAG: hypothetical protein QOK31_923 [Solirubrobacteraceae bacterium]|jgi:hypothetical protein|nr:hypothetical protein [Solirubrobacteraceae bacterium]
MARDRSTEEIRRSIETNREELGKAVGRVHAEIAELTDWRKHLRNHKREAVIGAAVAGFVIGGGIAAIGGLFSRS